MPNTMAKQLVRTGRINPFARTPEQTEEYTALVTKATEEAQENWDNPQWHRDMARDVNEALDWGFVNESLFGSYVSYEQLGEYDRKVLKYRRGLKAFSTARGGYVEESQLFTEVWEVPRDSLGFHVSLSEDDIRANFGPTIADVTSLGVARLNAEINRRFFQMLQAGVPNTAANYHSASGLSKTTLDAAIVEVKDQLRPDGMGPMPVTIAGRAGMVDQISDFTGFANEALEEIRRMGRLGTYRGCNVVVINHHADEDGVSYFPANELWVFAGNVGSFVKFGGLRSKEWTEDAIDYWHYKTTCDIGGVIQWPEYSARFIDTAITP